jgi:hypothetical protein
MEPFHGTERTVALAHTKHGDAGSLSVTLLFQPEIIMRTRKNTSTFSTAGRAMTQIGTAPLSVGKGVFHGVTGIFKHGGGGNGSPGGADSSEEDLNAHAQVRGAVPDLPGTQMSQPVGAGEGMGMGPSITSAAATGAAPPMPPVPASGSGGSLSVSVPVEPGLLRVTVLEAKDIYSGPESVKPYVSVRVGEREFKTKHAGKTVAPEWCVSFRAFLYEEKG